MLTWEIKPSGKNITARVSHALVDFRESYLEVSSVGKITISGDSAGYTAAEIGLAVEGLFNRFHREVGVTSVSNFPESNLGITSKVYILGTISYEL